MDCVQATKPPYFMTHLKDDATLERTSQPFEAYLQSWVEAMESRAGRNAASANADLKERRTRRSRRKAGLPFVTPTTP